MTNLFQIESFVKKYVTKRSQSLFATDMDHYRAKLHENIHNRTLLVIGAAGTIGSNFVKAALEFGPSKLIVIDINENGLTELVRDCRSSVGIALPEEFKSYPISFSDKIFEKIFSVEGPFDIVANFAAHKHVRSEKDEFSIEAMINNNVLKAKCLLDLLLKHPPKHFFCVSTDKAANPVNVMGASKKLMEDVIMAYSSKIKITTARFANVAFSNGSLLAGFFERILKHQPLSCPSDVRRFFVSPIEAGQICLMACILGDSGDIFFPKLSAEEDLTSFASLVAPFLSQFSLEIDICTTEEEAKFKAASMNSNQYPVYLFKSDTSGEKLYEEFYTLEEQPVMEQYCSLGVVKPKVKKNIENVNRVIEEIENLFKSNVDKGDVVKLLTRLLPGFKHIETGLNLDQKM